MGLFRSSWFIPIHSVHVNSFLVYCFLSLVFSPYLSTIYHTPILFHFTYSTNTLHIQTNYCSPSAASFYTSLPSHSLTPKTTPRSLSNPADAPGSAVPSLESARVSLRPTYPFAQSFDTSNVERSFLADVE